MKLPREVKIRVRPDGKVEVETFGFVGSSCAELSEYLERLLAGERPQSDDVQREMKVDYYLAEEQQELGQEDRR
jgi:acylphosphatase